MTGPECERALLRDGWRIARQSGSHRTYRHPTKPGTVQVPMHAGKTVKPRTLSNILWQAGLGVDEFRTLL